MRKYNKSLISKLKRVIKVVNKDASKAVYNEVINIVLDKLDIFDQEYEENFD